MSKTKKVRSTGRWGARYGLKIRNLVKKVEDAQRKKHTCPNCLKPVLKREATGIWECKKCKIKFVGGAYTPKTATSLILKPVER